jgi:hypothetical protein
MTVTPRETGAQKTPPPAGIETDDDSRNCARNVLLADEEEGVVGRDEQRPADPDRLPVLATRPPPRLGDRCVRQHRRPGEIEPKRREQHRRNVGDADANRGERTPSEGGEQEERRDGARS